MINLYEIKDPSFLSDLSIKELEELSKEIRTFLIEKVSKTGGHLSSNLGMVELTLALHRVFESPKDKLIFDVGHQGYVHKILTGRAKDFDTLRQYKGLSGFLKRSESIHDIFEAGHSSTSVAAAAGIEFSKRFNGNSYKVIPIIGDGALTGGMAFEALNFLGGQRDHQPIIILNDNEMSISENIGYLARILNDIRSKATYRKIKTKTYKILPKFLKTLSSKVERGVKGFFINNNMFDELGYSYYGPINGHNFKELIKYLKIAKKSGKPCVIHVLTQKGKGYKFSENDQLGVWHGVGPFDTITGESLSKPKKNLHSWSDIIAEYMINYAELKKEFVIVIPAMIGGSGLIKFKELYPNRIIDVGIAEQMAVTMSSGFAISNVDVFTPIYSTFIQRAYDQVNHDVARQNLKVIFGIDRAGIVGADGETHQGIYDIPLLRHIPNIKIAHPRNAEEAYKILNYAFKINKSPFVIRYERGKTEYDFNNGITNSIYQFPEWEIMREGKSVVFISFGSMLEKVYEEVERLKLDVCIVDAKFIKPLDNEILKKVSLKDVPIVIYEESSLLGGFGSAVIEHFVINKMDTTKITLMGIKDEYIQQGTKEEILKELNLDLVSIIDVIQKIM
ncbi:MAG: 1-deoxy-D-xylulose-5-phosphate synthase [Candidatus Izimaplasma sp.]|nr:1-deoxy-D-xylulose-5-phosphate synthase [Candidatus Izimaplasma bacterium]